MKHPLDILYLGLGDGTSKHRADAYARLGHKVTHINLRNLLPKYKWVDWVTWHLGDEWLSQRVRSELEKRINGRRFDYCHVDSGEWVCTNTTRMLKKFSTTVINYNIDDPTGPRDRTRFHCYREALSEYDLVVVMRDINVEEAKALGAKRVLRVFMSADEVAHAPRVLTADDHLKWDCDVQFLGTWLPERGPFLLELIKQGVPLTIRGGRWEHAPEWRQLKKFWKSGPLVGDDYAKAIQCAKVNIGLLSKGNRDLHTTRSIEIPYLGGLLCAERTSEHLFLYKENNEALYWSTATEAAEQCIYAIADESKRRQIAENGQKRAIANRLTNESILSKIISTTHQPDHPNE